MKLTLRYLLPLLVAAFFCGTVTAQTTKWKEIHKVKKKETIFGIARDNGITVEELVKANPEMASPDYKLKKGETIFIPYPAANAAAKPSAGTAAVAKPEQPKDVDMRKREIRVGVMLPLHDVNGDGKRMVEYYRGMLMACDSLKQNGISVDVRAWNVPEDADIAKTLRDKNAARCDLDSRAAVLQAGEAALRLCPRARHQGADTVLHQCPRDIFQQEHLPGVSEPVGI